MKSWLRHHLFSGGTKLTVPRLSWGLHTCYLDLQMILNLRIKWVGTKFVLGHNCYTNFISKEVIFYQNPKLGGVDHQRFLFENKRNDRLIKTVAKVRLKQKMKSVVRFLKNSLQSIINKFMIIKFNHDVKNEQPISFSISIEFCHGLYLDIVFFIFEQKTLINNGLHHSILCFGKNHNRKILILITKSHIVCYWDKGLTIFLQIGF